MDKATLKKSKAQKASQSSTNIAQFKLEKNYAKKLIASNLSTIN